MPDPQPILIPLLNPNEPEAQLAALHISDGAYVHAGDPLCTLETTKSTAEVSAERDGFVIQLSLQVGQTVRAGDLLCYLAEKADWRPPANPAAFAEPSPASVDHPIPPGLRISQPALNLANSLGLDLTLLPTGSFVTENMVRELAGKSKLPAPVQTASVYAVPRSELDPTAILIYGGGGHGKALIDLLRALKTYRIAGIIDDSLARQNPGSQIMGLPVLGGAEVLAELYQQGIRLAVNAVGGIGNISVRIQVFHRLAEEGFSFPALVHPRAVVESSARLAAGVQIFPLAYVGSESRIGFGAIINTNAVVSHDCIVGDYANLSPGSILAGEVQVGEAALIGMGVTVNLRTRIGCGARLGNSSVIKSDVPDNGVVRAGTTWPA